MFEIYHKKGEKPVLCNEFDSERKAVINPEDHFEPMPGFPEICVGIFSDAILHEILGKYPGEEMVELKTCCGNHMVYKLDVNGTPVAFVLPWVGGPAAISCIEEVFPLGGKYFVFAGVVGVLDREIAERHLILPTAAVRDEGLSYHYLPPADEVALEPENVEACRKAMDALGLPWVEGTTWTTDAFYRETRGKVKRRQEQGCVCVEMECASLAAVAKFRGVRFAQFFWAGDNLDAPEWDKRSLSDRGATIGEKVFAAAVETGKNLQKLGGV